MNPLIILRRSVFLLTASLFAAEAGVNLEVLPSGFTYFHWELLGSISYWTTPIEEFADTTIYISLTQGYGAAVFYATTMYNGDPATLPGPSSSVCQWKSSVVGSSATAIISTGPNVSSPGGCPDVSVWLRPLNITIAPVAEQGQIFSPVFGLYAAFGLALHVPSMFHSHFPASVNSILNTPIVYDRQTIDAYSVVNSQPASVALGILSDRFVNNNPQNAFDSTLITVSPQLSDGDYAVFVMTADVLGKDAEPICMQPSDWPSPDQPLCSPWAWSFTTSHGA